MVSSYYFPGIVESAKAKVKELQENTELIKKIKRFDQVIREVTGHTFQELQGKRKTYPLSLLRAIFAEFVYEPDSVGKSMIGQILGGKNHAAVCKYFTQTLPSIKATPKDRELYDKIYLCIR